MNIEIEKIMKEIEDKCDELKKNYDGGKMNEDEMVSYENWCYMMKEKF